MMGSNCKASKWDWWCWGKLTNSSSSIHVWQFVKFWRIMLNDFPIYFSFHDKMCLLTTISSTLWHSSHIKKDRPWSWPQSSTSQIPLLCLYNMHDHKSLLDLPCDYWASILTWHFDNILEIHYFSRKRLFHIRVETGMVTHIDQTTQLIWSNNGM